MIQQTAFPPNDVLHRADLLLAAFPALGVLLVARLAVLGAGVLQLLQQLLQLGHLLLGVIHAALLGRLLHPLRHAVQVARRHGGSEVGRRIRSLTPRLLGQRLHVLLDCLAQLLHALHQLGLLGGGLRLGLSGVAQGLAGCLQRLGGAVHQPFFQRQRQLPHARLRLVNHVGVLAAAQQPGDGAQVQQHRGVPVERLRRIGQPGQGHARRLPLARGQAELAPHIQHGAGDRVLELALGQGEPSGGAASDLAGLVARHHLTLHGQPRPGMRRQVLHGTALRRLR